MVHFVLDSKYNDTRDCVQFRKDRKPPLRQTAHHISAHLDMLNEINWKSKPIISLFYGGILKMHDHSDLIFELIGFQCQVCLSYP